MKNPFLKQTIRSMHEGISGIYYYQANDICTMLIGGTYNQGKNYWKSLKGRNNPFNIYTGGTRTQLNLPCSDGKTRLCDVLSTDQLIVLIKHIKHKHAKPYKQWLGFLQMQSRQRGQNPANLFKCLGEAKRNKLMTDMVQKKKPLVLAVIAVSRVISFDAPYSSVSSNPSAYASRYAA